MWQNLWTLYSQHHTILQPQGWTLQRYTLYTYVNYRLIFSTASWYFIPCSIRATATNTGALQAITQQSVLKSCNCTRYQSIYKYIIHIHVHRLTQVCSVEVSPPSTVFQASSNCSIIPGTSTCIYIIIIIYMYIYT